MGESEIACPGPAPLSVSATISSRTAVKSVNLFPGRWRNSAQSEEEEEFEYCPAPYTYDAPE